MIGPVFLRPARHGGDWRWDGRRFTEIRGGAVAFGASSGKREGEFVGGSEKD